VATPGAPRGTSRRLSWIALLLPPGSILGMLLCFAISELGRRVLSRAIRSDLILGSMGAVPLAVLASVVLAAVAAVRARRERRAGLAGVPRALPLLALVSALLTAGLFTLVVWMALKGLGAFT